MRSPPIRPPQRCRRLAGVPALVALVLAVLAPAGEARAEPLLVAVAANFAAPGRALAAAFERAGGGPVVISTGSSGALYAQIVNGAPFAVFLSADAERPRLLERAGLAVPASRFTYAVGRLTLWRPRGLAGRSLEAELAGDLGLLAIANPRTAPYGAAAVQVLERLGAWTNLERQVVRGESVAQAHQFVASGAVEAGLVALSQVATRSPAEWLEVPAELHDPIEQQAVQIAGVGDRERAAAFLGFLRGAEARRLIEAAGYGVAVPVAEAERVRPIKGAVP